MSVGAPEANAIDNVEAWVMRGCMGREGQDLEWLTLVLPSFILLSVGIGPGVRHILDVVSPRSYVCASGGACFVCQGWSECLGVIWGVVFVWDCFFQGG